MYEIKQYYVLDTCYNEQQSGVGEGDYAHCVRGRDYLNAIHYLLTKTNQPRLAGCRKYIIRAVE